MSTLTMTCGNRGDRRYFKLRRRFVDEPGLSTLPPPPRPQPILKLPRHLPLQNGLELLTTCQHPAPVTSPSCRPAELSAARTGTNSRGVFVARSLETPSATLIAEAQAPSGPRTMTAGVSHNRNFAMRLAVLAVIISAAAAAPKSPTASASASGARSTRGGAQAGRAHVARRAFLTWRTPVVEPCRVAERDNNPHCHGDWLDQRLDQLLELSVCYRHHYGLTDPDPVDHTERQPESVIVSDIEYYGGALAATKNRLVVDPWARETCHTARVTSLLRAYARAVDAGRVLRRDRPPSRFQPAPLLRVGPLQSITASVSITASQTASSSVVGATSVSGALRPPLDMSCAATLEFRGQRAPCASPVSVLPL